MENLARHFFSVERIQNSLSRILDKNSGRETLVTRTVHSHNAAHAHLFLKTVPAPEPENPIRLIEVDFLFLYNTQKKVGFSDRLKEFSVREGKKIILWSKSKKFVSIRFLLELKLFVLFTSSSFS